MANLDKVFKFSHLVKIRNITNMAITPYKSSIVKISNSSHLFKVAHMYKIFKSINIK